MLDVLSRTLGDQKEGSVRANQLLGQRLPRHFLLLSCLDLPGRSMFVLFGLVLFSTCEAYLSTTSQVLVFSDRTEDVSKFDLFPGLRHFVGYQEYSRAPRDANFPVSRDNCRRRQDRLCTTWDQLRVRTISECVACQQ